MNKRVEPCDNFYEFVCGNFLNDVPLKQKLPQSSNIDIVIKKVDHLLQTSVQHGITDDDPKSFHKLKSLYNLCLKGEGK